MRNDGKEGNERELALYPGSVDRDVRILERPNGGRWGPGLF